MDILANLPCDLQEKVYYCYKNLEYQRNLPRQVPLAFSHFLVCSREEYSPELAGKFKDNEFNFTSTIVCDKNNMVWASHEIEWSCWTGWSFNILDIPLMILKSSKDIKKLIHLWKSTFAENVKYNYDSGKDSFQNRKTSGFELENIKYEYLSSKILKAYIKKVWFPDEIKSIEQIKQIKHRFRIEDSCFDLGSRNICIPYRYDDLLNIKKVMPTIYHCLETNGQLWSCCYKFRKPLLTYIKYWIALNDATMKDDDEGVFKGYPDMLPAEEFNEIVTNILKNELKLADYYFNSFSCRTGYIAIPDISEILQAFKFVALNLLVK